MGLDAVITAMNKNAAYHALLFLHLNSVLFKPSVPPRWLVQILCSAWKACPLLLLLPLPLLLLLQLLLLLLVVVVRCCYC